MVVVEEEDVGAVEGEAAVVVATRRVAEEVGDEVANGRVNACLRLFLPTIPKKTVSPTRAFSWMPHDKWSMDENNNKNEGHPRNYLDGLSPSEDIHRNNKYINIELAN